jgi:hypothetical protein
MSDHENKNEQNFYKSKIYRHILRESKDGAIVANSSNYKSGCAIKTVYSSCAQVRMQDISQWQIERSSYV